jgi:hypothetical protein
MDTFPYGITLLKQRRIVHSFIQRDLLLCAAQLARNEVPPFRGVFTIFYDCLRNYIRGIRKHGIVL